MRRTAAAFAVTASALLLTACSSSAKVSTSQDSTSPATAQPTASTASAAAPSQSGAATSLDPCQLVTSSEASSLAGTSYGVGKEETNGSGEKICVYGYQTTNVFTVEVAQAQDAGTAQADWAQQQAQAQAAVQQKLPAGINISLNTSKVSGLGDRAATANGTTSVAGQTLGLSGIYLLKGITFLAFQDVVLGHAAPSSADMQAEAKTALARVP
jgi:hypothetical protein